MVTIINIISYVTASSILSCKRRGVLQETSTAYLMTERILFTERVVYTEQDLNK